MTDNTENTAPVPGTPEYDAAMIAIKRQAQEEQGNPLQPEEAPAGEQPVAPEGVPEKFIDPATGQIDVEKLLASYKELEKGRQPKETPEAEAPKMDDEKAASVAEKAGLDWNALTSKVAETGDIDEADYAAFEKIGIPSDLVKDVIEMRKEQFAREQAAAIEYAGGEEAANELMAWAGQNLKPKEIEQYNELLSGPHWRVAIDSLKAQRDGSRKTAGEPKLMSPSGGSAPVTGYTNRDEMRADMRNPLYREMSPAGEAFRRQVMQKAALAPWNRK